MNGRRREREKRGSGVLAVSVGRVVPNAPQPSHNAMSLERGSGGGVGHTALPNRMVGRGGVGHTALPDAADGGGLGQTALPVRKMLDHRGPIRVDVSAAWYFVTICAAERGGSTMVDHAAEIINAARHYHEIGKWFVALLLVMPDHIHMLVHVPMSFSGRAVCPKPPQSCHNEIALGGDFGGLRHTALPKYRTNLEHVIGEWKRYLSRTAHICFQRDFWDTRIRDAAHYAEKWDYIVNNPVARGLVATSDEWPHVLAFDRTTGEERS